eukprot:scaffold24260_cov126-Isochrysis_galbana.AAC.5
MTKWLYQPAASARARRRRASSIKHKHTARARRRDSDRPLNSQSNTNTHRVHQAWLGQAPSADLYISTSLRGGSGADGGADGCLAAAEPRHNLVDCPAPRRRLMPEIHLSGDALLSDGVKQGLLPLAHLPEGGSAAHGYESVPKEQEEGRAWPEVHRGRLRVERGRRCTEAGRSRAWPEVHVDRKRVGCGRKCMEAGRGQAGDGAELNLPPHRAHWPALALFESGPSKRNCLDTVEVRLPNRHSASCQLLPNNRRRGDGRAARDGIVAGRYRRRGRLRRAAEAGCPFELSGGRRGERVQFVSADHVLGKPDA